jgi:hypothetical protein
MKANSAFVDYAQIYAYGGRPDLPETQHVSLAR